MKTVDIFSKLPDRFIDPRITVLHAHFKRNVFTLEEGARVLGLSTIDALGVLSYRPLSDCRFRISKNNRDFWLVTVDPALAAASHWVPLIEDMPRFFTHNIFAMKTGIPHFSSNFILSTLTRAGFLRSGHHSGEFINPRSPPANDVEPKPPPKPKRKIVWGPVVPSRPRRIIWRT